MRFRMNSLVINKLLFVSFLCFICWIIYLANTGGHSLFFTMVRSFPYGDKVGHFGLFGMLTLLANMATKNAMFTLANMRCLWASAVIVVLVTLEELSQHFLSHRNLDLYDWLADMAGISCFSLLNLYVANKFRCGKDVNPTKLNRE
ncbi:VanZ family protein [Corallincola spongiicola]|nr:VanZ family protein [Corallincola spongiicola]